MFTARVNVCPRFRQTGEVFRAQWKPPATVPRTVIKRLARQGRRNPAAESYRDRASKIGPHLRKVFGVFKSDFNF
jgi:hypothetical protein